MLQEELKHFCLGATTKEPLQAILTAKYFHLQQIREKADNLKHKAVLS